MRKELDLIRFLALVIVLSLFVNGPLKAAAEPDAASTTTSRLLLPYYEVETNKADGISTLFALRNESLASIEVDILYYEVDAPAAPQKTERVTLTAKQVKTVNIRDVQNLEVDGDFFARGYAVFQTVGAAGPVLSGDYFRVDPANDFAVGERLADISPTSSKDERCSIYSVRFIRGGVFSGGTRMFYWLDSSTLQTDPGTMTYSVYNEAGQLLTLGQIPTPDVVSGGINLESILGNLPPTEIAGVVEIQFKSGLLGHIALEMRAFSRFAVSFTAACRE
jgi:hypothetical protein